MSEHVWAQENIAAYVAGGLEASEGERLEEHVADCLACARFVDEARSLEKKLAPLVLAAAPGPALEDRIIQSLPPVQATPRMNSLSGKRKAVLAAAAAMLLAVLGAGVSALIEKKNLGFPAASPVRMAQAVDDDQSVRAYAVGDLVKDASESMRVQVRGGEAPLPSADDLAAEFREKALAPLMEETKTGESKGNRESGQTRRDALAKDVNKPKAVRGFVDVDGSISRSDGMNFDASPQPSRVNTSYQRTTRCQRYLRSHRR
jgi:hypothetical protein